MEKTNEKEIINLLDSLSNSGSDVSDVVLTPPRKKIVKRRPRLGVKTKQNNSCSCSHSQSKKASLCLAAVLITFWLIALSWLAAVFYGEIGRIDISIRAVKAESEAVPDTLHKCHTLFRDLQKNQTKIFNQLSGLDGQLNNFTVQLLSIQQGLHEVQESLQGAPELTDVPKNIKTLFSNTASFGSQIRDLGATVDILKEANTKLHDVQTIVQQNLTDIRHSLLDLSNMTLRPQTPTNESRIKDEALSNAIAQLASNLTHINETLSRNITWIAEDQAKDHTKLVTLQDMMQNASGNVMTLQEQCAKASDQTILVTSVNKLTDQMNEVHTWTKQMEQSFNALKNSASTMQASIADWKNQQEGKVNDEASLQPQMRSSHEIKISTKMPVDSAETRHNLTSKNVHEHTKVFERQ
ncbi:uncharacterized protein [Venturia canescens]|uniref:uncharacterized protein isoform X2 n=1 Tax=Venturia canescens TaxID=32260 RepID=UPI001C9CAB3C|nr:uncharacterized protein LOC122416385 isoform X2 [Venturia canescens]